jgi:hypothetical protein
MNEQKQGAGKMTIKRFAMMVLLFGLLALGGVAAAQDDSGSVPDSEYPRLERWLALAERRIQLGVIRLAAEETGRSPREIRRELRAGTPLADILTENGVDVVAFTDEVVERVGARLNVLVADNRITQERADELLAEFREQFEARITGAEAAA